jgi:catechol 2,3-dioxygenase-like lactoylglutathione lyase family enzyme
MPLSHLEHLLILADDVEATKDWYVDVLGFRVGEHPDFGVHVYWLYLGDGDVLHVVQAADEGAPGDANAPPASGDIASGGRPIHHVAFRATGLAEMRAHLEAGKIEFLEQQAGNQNLYQIFLRDPNGVTIELNFPADEADGLQAPTLVLTNRDKDWEPDR